jgi:hypothetical protein
MTTNITVGVFGQSFAVALLQGGPEAVMKDEFARNGCNLTLDGYAYGGSAASKVNNPNAYWYDPDTGANGPCLNSALSRIAAMSVKPAKVIWAQGEGESTNPNIDVAQYNSVTSIIIAKLKAACNPAYPTSTGCIHHIIGRRISSAPWPGVQKVKEAQLGFTFSTYGFDTYDLPLLGDDPLNASEVNNSHMDPKGYAIMGYRASQRLLQSLSKPYRMPPNVGTISADGYSVTIQITAQTEFLKPACPAHFAIRDGSTILEEFTASWAGNTLTLTSAVPFSSGANLLYPYGSLNTINRAALIYDACGAPLRSFAATLNF